jgi:hypothetical protein
MKRSQIQMEGTVHQQKQLLDFIQITGQDQLLRANFIIPIYVGNRLSYHI